MVLPLPLARHDMPIFHERFPWSGLIIVVDFPSMEDFPLI
jgi:hypothetical protein